MLQKILLQALLCLLVVPAMAQQADTIPASKTDSLYMLEFEKKRPLKLLHAEPLFIDLIRDLGAHKGEREWNIGFGLTDNKDFDSYSALVEYEWAPLDRLGLEVELPFTFYSGSLSGKAPSAALNSLKLAAQYTLLVSAPAKTSVAVGYLHELELPTFREYGKTGVLQGHLASPFGIVAKRWGANFHSLVYAGPLFHYNRQEKHWKTSGQWNTSFHYMLSGTRNFIGLEINKEWVRHDVDITLRPQMRLGISDHLLIGIVAGIPVQRENQRLSSFIRLIYEPPHRKRF